MDLYLGVEIGGTKQQIAVGDARGELLHTVTERVVLRRGAADILDWLEGKLKEVLESPRFGGGVKAVGVGFGGPLETANGRVIKSLQVPGWDDFQIKTWVEGQTRLPVTVWNDTAAGGYAEWMLGAGEQTDSYFYTNIGTGIGGVHIIEGRVQDGFGYGASFLGNTYVPDWTAELPGAETEMELLCSGAGIEKRLNRPEYIPAHSSLATLGRPVTCPDLAQAVGENDAFAVQELDRVCKTFSLALCNLLMVSPVRRVVIGGGVANMGPPLFERIRRFTEQYAYVANKGQVEILQSRLLDGAVVKGAVLLAAQSHGV